MVTAAANTESLGKMRRVHGLTNTAVIQLYVNELADMLYIFAKLSMPSTASEIETVSDTAVILLNVYMVIAGEPIK